MRPSSILLALAVTCTCVAAGGLRAQTLEDLRRSVEQGGGWVGIPIVAGEGSVSTPTVPTMGLTLAGCVQVWGGHSGSWDITARDLMGEGRLAVKAEPGEGVPFAYTSGMSSKLEVDVQWSEPRDTTLLLWIGLETGRSDGRDACEPVTG